MSQESPALHFGVTLQGIQPPDEFVQTVRMIEANQLTHLWLTDSSLHARCVYSYLVLAALNSQKLNLGTAVTHPFTRHPAINVNSIATLAEISQGRSILGVGAGDSPTMELGYQPAKVKVLRDMIEVSRQLLDGQTVDFEGEAFSLNKASLHWSQENSVPIYLACSGPKMLALAGEIADGALVLCGAFPDAVQFALERISAGAEGVGRSLDDIDVWFMLYGAIKDDRDEAYDDSRSLAAWFSFRAPHYCRLAGFPETLIKKIETAYSGGEFHLAKEAAKLTPDEMVEMFTVGGTPDQAEARIQLLSDNGVKAVNFFPIGTDRVDSIDRFARQLIPNLTSSSHNRIN